MMVVCVEAGLGLDQAMRKVADEMKTAYPHPGRGVRPDELPVADGPPRAEVLHDLGVRTGVADLRALAAVLIQADKFGSSIAQALRVQSESMRDPPPPDGRRKGRQDGRQLIFPLVLFIFPGIFVVLVGPAAITMVRQMFPADGRLSRVAARWNVHQATAGASRHCSCGVAAPTPPLPDKQGHPRVY